MRCVRPVLVLVLALAVAGCAEPASDPQQPTFSPAGSTSPTGVAATPPPPADAATLKDAVIVQSNRFTPEQLFVEVGALVTWLNNDPVPHTVTFDDLSFDRDLPDLGTTTSRTFGTNGTFGYRCKVHPSMRGSVIVGTGVVDALAAPTPNATATPAPASPPPPPSATPSPTPTPTPTPSPTPTATPTPPPTPTPTPTPTAVTINIQGFAFSGTHTVPVGTTVTWKNLDGSSHTATANDGSFDTGSLAQGQTASHTFTTAGSYPYKCAFHPSMTATLTVTA